MQTDTCIGHLLRRLPAGTLVRRPSGLRPASWMDVPATDRSTRAAPPPAPATAAAKLRLLPRRSGRRRWSVPQTAGRPGSCRCHPSTARSSRAQRRTSSSRSSSSRSTGKSRRRCSGRRPSRAATPPPPPPPPSSTSQPHPFLRRQLAWRTFRRLPSVAIVNPNACLPSVNE